MPFHFSFTNWNLSGFPQSENFLYHHCFILHYPMDKSKFLRFFFSEVVFNRQATIQIPPKASCCLWKLFKWLIPTFSLISEDLQGHSAKSLNLLHSKSSSHNLCFLVLCQEGRAWHVLSHRIRLPGVYGKLSLIYKAVLNNRTLQWSMEF